MCEKKTIVLNGRKGYNHLALKCVSPCRKFRIHYFSRQGLYHYVTCHVKNTVNRSTTEPSHT